MRAILLLTLALTAQPSSAPRSVKPGSLGIARGGRRPLTPELSTKVRWPQSLAISPDGSLIALALKETNLEENTAQTQLYLLATGPGGGELRQLTFTGSNNSEPSWSPDGHRIAFASTREDSSQIYVLDLSAGGEAKRLTALAGGASAPIWSPDGKTIAFTSSVYPDCQYDSCNRQRNEERAKSKLKARAYDALLYRHWNTWDEGTRAHIFTVPADGGDPPRDLTPGHGSAPAESLNESRGYAFASNETIVFVANQERELAISTNNDLFTVSLKGGPPRAITTNKALDAQPEPSPDGRYIAYVAASRPGYESDRTVLYVYDRKTEKRVARTESFDRAVEELAWLPSGQGLYLTAYNHGHRELFSVGLDAGEVTPVLPNRNVHQLSVSRKGTIAFVESSFNRPPEVFVYDPDLRSAKQISHLNDAFAENLSLGRVEELEVDNHGVTVHGFINYPPDFRAENRYPLVVLLHGGPQGAFVDTWHSRWNSQIFAARGYVVAMPNFRGSTGYGQKFLEAVSKDWGGGAYEDVMAFTDALATRSFIDERWMCAAGASYGGYMVNWIAGHTQRFKCLITHAGVFNLESMWGDTEELWFPEWEFGGTPWIGRESYRRMSPHEYIQNAKTPTLVTHGQLDFRVQLSQGQQMFTSLQRLGVPSRFVYFPDEGHWITKPANYVYWYNEMLGWLSRYLR